MNKLITKSVSLLTRREALIEMFACLNDKDKLKDVVDKDPVLDCALFCLAMADPKHMDNLRELLNVDELTEDVLHCYEDLHRRERLKLLSERFAEDK